MVAFLEPVACPVYADPPYAPQWEAELRNVATRPLRVSSPCVGLNSPERAIRELGVPCVDVDQYDLRQELKSVLGVLCGGDCSYTKVGPDVGNMMDVHLAELEGADALVPGLMCLQQLISVKISVAFMAAM